MGKKQVSFETALEQLEKIVEELEDGEIGLEASLQRYEDGVKLLRQCYDILQHAERRIELLTGVGEDGRPTTEPFDATATAEQTQRNRPKRRASPKGDEDEDDAEELETGQLF